MTIESSPRMPVMLVDKLAGTRGWPLGAIPTTFEDDFTLSTLTPKADCTVAADPLKCTRR